MWGILARLRCSYSDVLSIAVAGQPPLLVNPDNVVTRKPEQLPFLDNTKIGIGVGSAGIILAILRVADLVVHTMTLLCSIVAVNSDLRLLTLPS